MKLRRYKGIKKIILVYIIPLLLFFFFHYWVMNLGLLNVWAFQALWDTESFDENPFFGYYENARPIHKRCIQLEPYERYEICAAIFFWKVLTLDRVTPVGLMIYYVCIFAPKKYWPWW